jgi:hypothetical protein
VGDGQRARIPHRLPLSIQHQHIPGSAGGAGAAA